MLARISEEPIGIIRKYNLAHAKTLLPHRGRWQHLRALNDIKGNMSPYRKNVNSALPTEKDPFPCKDKIQAAKAKLNQDLYNFKGGLRDRVFNHQFKCDDEDMEHFKKTLCFQCIVCGMQISAGSTTEELQSCFAYEKYPGVPLLDNSVLTKSQMRAILLPWQSRPTCNICNGTRWSSIPGMNNSKGCVGCSSKRV